MRYFSLIAAGCILVGLQGCNGDVFENGAPNVPPPPVVMLPPPPVVVPPAPPPEKNPPPLVEFNGLRYIETITPASSSPDQVVLADLDGDGLQDVVLGSAKNNSLDVLYGLGARQFSDPVPLAGPVFSSGQEMIGDLQLVDFNRDGALDVLFHTFSGKEILIGMNKKEGGSGSRRNNSTFSWSALTIPRGFSFSRIYSVVHADWNKDGKEDIAVAYDSTAGSGPATILWYYGKGRGKFHAPVKLEIRPTEKGALVSLRAADLNKDGRQDLVAGLVVGSPSPAHYLTVLLSKADGRMEAPRLYPVDFVVDKLAFEDMNGDGLMDIVGLSPTGDVFVRFQRPGPGFAFDLDPSWKLPEDKLDDLILVDADRDGHPDVVGIRHVWHEWTAYPVATGELVVYRTDSKGVVGKALPSPMLGWRVSHSLLSRGLASADLDGDGHQDVVALAAGSGTVSIFAGEAAANFVPLLDRSGYRATPVQALVHPEFSVVFDRAAGTLWSYSIGNGFDEDTGGFFDGNAHALVGWAGVDVAHMAMGDFDSDGHDDLVVADRISSKIRLVRNQWVRGLSRPALDFASFPAMWSVPFVPSSTLVVDWDQDAKNDVMVFGETTDNVLIYKGNGAFSLGAARAVNLGVPAFKLHHPVVADFDRNGRPDLAVLNAADGQAYVWFQDAAGASFRTYSVGGMDAWREMVVGDVDRDGYPDLLLIGTNSIWVAKNDHTGGFAVPTRLVSVTDPASLQWRDVNQDGWGDLLFLDRAAVPKIVLLRGDGRGGFVSELVLPAEGGVPYGKDARLVTGTLQGGKPMVLLLQPELGLLQSFLVTKS